MKSAHPRFHEIDLLRGIACFSVLFFHYIFRGPRTHSMPGVDYPWAEMFAHYGDRGVDLFFVISGFVIFMSATGATPRDFLTSRVARLYPGLWFAATLTAGAAWILRDARFGVSFYDYLINLSMLAHWFNTPYVDGVYWSLGYELHFYILVWLMLRLGLMPKVEWLLAGWLLISTANAVRPMWPVEFWLDAQWAPSFTAGAVFYMIRTSGFTPARLGLLAISFALALVYAVTDEQWRYPPAVFSLLPSYIVAGITLGIFCLFWLIATCRFQMKASPLTFYAGMLTYPVYLIHQNFGFMLFAQLRKVIDSVPLALALLLVGVLAISWAIHVLAERPLGRLLKRALDRPVAVKAAAPLRADSA